MKQTNFLPMIFLLIGICVFISCSKEEVQNFRTKTDILTNVEGRSITPSECGYINELCRPCKIRKAPDLVMFRMVAPGGDEFLVTPENIFEGSRDFRIQSEAGQYILSNSNNDYIRSRADSIEIPPGLINILRTSETVLSDSTISDSQIQMELDVPIFRNDSNEIVVNIGDFETIDDDSTYFLIDDCRGQELRVMESYYKHLNEPFEVFSEATASVWMSNVDFYFEKCAEGVDLDYDCFDPRCIVGSLLDAFENSWSDTQVKNLKLNYLSLLLNLDEDETEALGNADIELINELYTKSECGTVHFCPFEKDQNDNISDIVKGLISSNELNLDNFNNSLALLDHIDKNPLLKQKCPKAACLIEKMQEENLSDIYCDMILGFDGESTLDLEFTAGSVFSNADASTSRPKNGKITITINQISCEGEHIVDLVGTILHEGIHAHMYKAVFDAGFDILDPNSYSEIFDTALSVKWKYNQQGQAQHEIMAKTMIDDIAKSLQQYFGFGYDLDYFIWIAWQGLQRYGVYVEDYNDQDWDYYENKYEELKNLIPDECI